LHGAPAEIAGEPASAFPPVNIQVKPASDAVRKARRELFMAKHYRNWTTLRLRFNSQNYAITNHDPWVRWVCSYLKVILSSVGKVDRQEGESLLVDPR
jgi:hypothetical protein